MEYNFSKALAVGTTGMLAAATQTLADNAKQTLVVSRHGLAALQENNWPRSTALDADYADTSAFMNTLSARTDLGAIDIAVLWIRDPGLEILFRLLAELAKQPVRIIHIAGSAAGTPQHQARRMAQKIDFSPQSHYCPVILGAMPDANGRRWLTHEEICAGTIKAIRTGEPQMIGHPLADL